MVAVCDVRGCWGEVPYMYLSIALDFRLGMFDIFEKNI